MTIQGEEQWVFACYINQSNVREKFREQAQIFDDELDDELDDEEPRLVDAYIAKTAKLCLQSAVCMRDEESDGPGLEWSRGASSS